MSSRGKASLGSCVAPAAPLLQESSYPVYCLCRIEAASLSEYLWYRRTISRCSRGAQNEDEDEYEKNFFSISQMSPGAEHLFHLDRREHDGHRFELRGRARYADAAGEQPRDSRRVGVRGAQPHAEDRAELGRGPVQRRRQGAISARAWLD